MSSAPAPSVNREFSYIGLRIVQYGVLFVSTVIVARSLGPSGRAHYSLPLALSGAVWIVTHLTIEGSAGRLFGRREAVFTDTVGVLIACMIGLSVIGIGATLAIGTIFDHALLAGAHFPILLAAALTIPGLLMMQVIGYLLLMLGLIRQYGTASAVSAACQLAIVAGLAGTGRLTPFLAVLTTAIGFAVWGALMTVVLARHVGMAALVPRLDRRILGALVRTSGGIHPLSVAIQLGPRLELLIVGALTSARSTGLYSLALTIAEVPHYVAYSLSQTGVRPITEHEEADAIDYAAEFTRQTALVSIPMSLAGCVFAFPFITIVYGTAWLGAVVPMMILILGTIAWSIENPLRVLLLRIARPIHMAGMAVAGVALNAALTVALMQPLGIIGAALGSFIAYWAFALSMVWLARNAAGSIPIRRSLRSPSADDWIVGVGANLLRRIRSGGSSGSAPETGGA